MVISDLAPFIGPTVTIILAICGFIFFFIRRELRRLDALPKAIKQLSRAIQHLSRWKLSYSRKNDAEIRGIKRTMRRINHKLQGEIEAHNHRLTALESKECQYQKERADAKE